MRRRPHGRREAIRPWLPAGKTAAVCFSIDDVHPATSRDAYEAGGDRGAGALGRLVELQRRHRELKATLCVTPDWRLNSIVPNSLMRHVPWFRRCCHWTRLHRPGRFRIDRHPELVSYLNGLERCEIVPHGLEHAHVGPQFAVEFQNEPEEWCVRNIQKALQIFRAARLRSVRGYAPPSWNAPPALIAALGQLKFEFFSSARDLETPIEPEAKTAGSGLRNVSLLFPEVIGPAKLVHISCNFQATSRIERALQILEHGGVLHIKAHIFKAAGGHVMLDGLDELYCNYLDVLFSQLTAHFGRRLWWAHMSEISTEVRRAA